MPAECTIAKRLLSKYTAAQSALDEADKSLKMNDTMSDPAYIAVWIARRKADKDLLNAMKEYRRHLERHQCQSGLFTDVA